jgi:hypothetical protein
LDPRQISLIREAACQIANSNSFPKLIPLGNTHRTLYLAGGFGNPASLPGIQTGPKLVVLLPDNIPMSLAVPFDRSEEAWIDLVEKIGCMILVSSCFIPSRSWTFPSLSHARSIHTP